MTPQITSLPRLSVFVLLGSTRGAFLSRGAKGGLALVAGGTLLGLTSGAGVREVVA
jgi:hypothetical protein